MSGYEVTEGERISTASFQRLNVQDKKGFKRPACKQQGTRGVLQSIAYSFYILKYPLILRPMGSSPSTPWGNYSWQLEAFFNTLFTILCR